MSGRLDDTNAAETVKDVARPILLAFFDFISEPMRLWSGVGDLTWNGQTWKGIGTFGRVTSVEETVELRAAGMSLELSGVNSDNIVDIVSEPIQGQRAQLWLGFLDENFALITDPVLLFDGRMDTIEITDGGPTAVIALAVENRLRDLERPRLRRYTDADQQSRYPGDRGLEYVPSVQDLDIPWGRAKDA